MGRPHRHGAVFQLTCAREVTDRRIMGKRLGFVLLALLSSNPAVAGLGDLPNLGHPSAVVMSRAQQTAFGKAFLAHARGTYRFVHNPDALAFVRTLGRRLVAASFDPQIDFHFYILKNPVVNAFSVPGGYVFINTGAIIAARNEDELAAVMSHEISHDTQRHIPRLIALSHKLSWAALAGVLAGALLMGTSQFEGGAAAMSLSSAALASETLKHRRGYESEADHFGLRTMARAGFNPHAMAAFFKRLKTYDRFMSVDIPESWRTHPATDIRIAEAENLAARYPNPPIPDRPAFDRFQAVLLAREGSPHTTAARLAHELKGRHDPSARRYGEAVADMRLGRFTAARRRLGALIAASPRVVAYRMTLAQLWRDTGHLRAAVAVLRGARTLRPQSLWIGVLDARALLDAGDTAAAHRLIKHLIDRAPYRPDLYRTLAHVYGRRHDYLHAHEALAESLFLEGDGQGANAELRLAAPFATQPAARARLKTLKVAFKEGWPAPPTFP